MTQTRRAPSTSGTSTATNQLVSRRKRVRPHSCLEPGDGHDEAGVWNVGFVNPRASPSADRLNAPEPAPATAANSERGNASPPDANQTPRHPRLGTAALLAALCSVSLLIAAPASADVSPTVNPAIIGDLGTNGWYRGTGGSNYVVLDWNYRTWRCRGSHRRLRSGDPHRRTTSVDLAHLHRLLSRWRIGLVDKVVKINTGPTDGGQCNAVAESGLQRLVQPSSECRLARLRCDLRNCVVRS